MADVGRITLERQRRLRVAGARYRQVRKATGAVFEFAA
jgi:hypothetical protein